MYDLFRRIRLNFLLTSVLSCILGLLLITSPGAAMRTVFLLVGWMLVTIMLGFLVCSMGLPRC